MASSVVFKVKYEDTLRRFNARVDENQLMDLDIAGLRAKIRSLFNFTADADFKLTYLDEDHDIVDLVDEEDLLDVVRQALDPVRLTVKLNTGKTSSTALSGLSTPVRQQGHTSSLDNNAGFADLLKTVPEPLREILSKLSAEATSKAASTSPMLADLVEGITKVGQSFLNVHPPSQSGPAADLAASQEFGEAALKSNCTEASDAVNATQPVDGSTSSAERVNQSMQDRKKGIDFEALQCRSQLRRDRRKGKGLIDDCKKMHEKGSSGQAGQETAIPAVSKLLQRVPMTPLPNPWFPTAHRGPVFHGGVQCDVCGVCPIIGPRFKSKVKDDYDLCITCFKQMGNDADYKRIDVAAASHRHPCAFKGNLAGPRHWPHHPPQPLFPVSGKQKQARPKLDSRFIMDVNVMDGTVMAPKTTFTKVWRMRNSGNLPWVPGFQLVWIGGDKFSYTDSVQIVLPAAGLLYPEGEVDVAVDFIAPELPGRYISYWKVAAPSGLKFGQRVWVLIQVDAALSDASSAAPGGLNLNLPPEAITGDNTPEALDEDVEPLVDIHYEPTTVDEQRNKLNLPEDGWYFQPQPMTYPTVKGSMPEALPASKPVSASRANLYPTVDPSAQAFIHSGFTHQATDTTTYPTVDPSSPAFGSAGALPPVADVPVGSAVTQEAGCPAIDVPVGKTTPAERSGLGHSTVPMGRPINVEVSGHNAMPVGRPIPVEISGHNVEALLSELAEMGFKQTNLNRLVLKRNNYNLEQSLDELCGFSEWDMLLEELQGMGFVDREMNEKALAKNNGSIKHAVMDLITRENA